jgi:hypothetical protein
MIVSKYEKCPRSFGEIEEDEWVGGLRGEGMWSFSRGIGKNGPVVAQMIPWKSHKSHVATGVGDA